MYIKRLDESNYRDYQRCMRRIVYAMSKKGESNSVAEAVSKKTGEGIMTKPEFLEEIVKPNVAIYCLKDDEDNNIGITAFVFIKQECKICEFAVFEQLKGLGTAFYKMVEDVIRIRQPRVREIKLICPFEGAQEFWKKQGFSLLYSKDKIKMKLAPEFWRRI